MEILEAFDLTGSYRDAGVLAECSHHTVARYVEARAEGRLTPGAPACRPSVIDGFLPKLEELVDRSKGKIRADQAHDKIVAMGFAGSERTTRRAVAEFKRAWRAGRRRVHRPWVPEPGMWAQYDFGDGPRLNGTATILFCFWVAWCRFRVVLPLLDKTQPSVFAAVDAALRRVGGCPTYLLTDNEKTVTVEHVAGVPVRNPATVQFARHYGLTVATCVPADPATKGGSEATVRIAKADLVPTETNLRDGYRSFAELEEACLDFCDQVNARPHRVTRRPPAEMLAEERARLHPLPAAPFTAAFGVTRTVGSDTPMISFDTAQYSVPHTLAGQTVWVRRHGEQVVIVHVGADGPVEVGPACADHTGQSAAGGHALPAAAARRAGPRAAGSHHRGGGVPGDRRRGRVVADRGRRGRREPGAGEDGRGGRAGPAAPGVRGGPGARAGRDRQPVRRRGPRGDPHPPGRSRGRAGEDHTLAQGTAGWAGFGEPEVTR